MEQHTLAAKCGMCGSRAWCGRPCRNSPKQAEPAPKGGPCGRFKDGKGYSPRTGMYQHQCRLCGADFVGSLDKQYCSDPCRVNAWRQRRAAALASPPAKIGERLLIGWGQKRFAVLERDGFKCRYCGRGAKENVVLQVDHVVPRSAGGTDDLSNLLTACSECNGGKGHALIERLPD